MGFSRLREVKKCFACLAITTALPCGQGSYTAPFQPAMRSVQHY